MIFTVAPFLAFAGAGVLAWYVLYTLGRPGTGSPTLRRWAPWIAVAGFLVGVAGVSTWFSAEQISGGLDEVYAQGACAPFGGYGGIRAGSVADPVMVGAGPGALHLPRFQTFFCHDGTTVETQRSALAAFKALRIVRPPMPTRATARRTPVTTVRLATPTRRTPDRRDPHGPHDAAGR